MSTLTIKVISIGNPFRKDFMKADLVVDEFIGITLTAFSLSFTSIRTKEFYREYFEVN